jgi:glycosyltransferase involved in cell wall biosynthesis
MIISLFPPEAYGGAEQQCLRQSKALVERGHEVTILTSRKSFRIPAKENIDGVNVRRLLTFVTPDLLGRWLPFSLLWLVESAHFACWNRNKFDIVHNHLGKFGMVVGTVVSKICRVPQLVKLGNSGKFLDLNSLRKKKFIGAISLKYALKGSPHFIAISQMIQDDLIAFGINEKQITPIPNMVKTLNAEYLAPQKVIKFFWHGRFEHIKNIELMLRGVALAKATSSHFKLYLVGDGTLEESLRDKVAEFNIQEFVEFIPPPSDVIQTISSYDIMINTSFNEGMSNSMLEALALGKAIVSTPVSGSQEIIDEGNNGFIISEYTPEAVALAIKFAQDMYNEASRSVFDYNMNKVETSFRTDVLAERIESLYIKLLDIAGIQKTD